MVVKKNDDKMKVARCLNFCRDQKYDFAGLYEGRSCRCLSEEDEFAALPPARCLENHCSGDAVHSCGGEDAIAVYDSEYW